MSRSCSAEEPDQSSGTLSQETLCRLTVSTRLRLPAAITDAKADGQGSRMSLVCDDLEPGAVVPGGFFAPAAEAGLRASVLGDKVEGDLANESEGAHSRPVAHAAVILPEGDVQHPMQRVLNTPRSEEHTSELQSHSDL